MARIPLAHVHGADRGGAGLGAVLSGVKFDDLDGNGTRHAGEPGLEGGTVELDLDADGERDTGEPGLARVTVCLDRNDNGGLDDGEPSTTAEGQWARLTFDP